MKFANSWGTYNCFQGRDEELIDLECRADFFALDPVGKVFKCISEQGDTITLKYGEQTFRVKAERYRMVPKPFHHVGDTVEVIDKATKGKVLDVNWHIKDNEPFYFLEIKGKRNKKRYKNRELRSLTESSVGNKIVTTSLSLEEYIPLKVRIDRKDEPVKYLSYSKDKSSLLEITVGAESRFIKRITLLLSKEYNINDSKLNIDAYETGDLKVNDQLENGCSYFKTCLYADGVRIIISEEKVCKYVKMDRLYVGLSSLGNIVEISLCQLSANEVSHIKNELDHQ